MTIYFNILIPIKAFLEIAEEVMSKHDARLYIEKISANNDKKRRYYVTGSISEKDFIDKEYCNFFFSSKAINVNDKEIILESGEVIYSNWFSFYDDNCSIEGLGGREDDKNVEYIRLRSVYKEPDKQIKSFYNALQIRLKRTENIKLYKQGSLRVYFLDTEKKTWSNFEKQIPATLTPR